MDRFGLVVMAVQDDPVRSRNDDLALNPVAAIIIRRDSDFLTRLEFLQLPIGLGRLEARCRFACDFDGLLAGDRLRRLPLDFLHALIPVLGPRRGLETGLQEVGQVLFHEPEIHVNMHIDQARFHADDPLTATCPVSALQAFFNPHQLGTPLIAQHRSDSGHGLGVEFPAAHGRTVFLEVFRHLVTQGSEDHGNARLEPLPIRP
jgi:hypothetical protein